MPERSKEAFESNVLIPSGVLFLSYLPFFDCTSLVGCYHSRLHCLQMGNEDGAGDGGWMEEFETSTMRDGKRGCQAC